MITDAKIIKSTDDKVNEFRQHLLNEIKFTHERLAKEYPPIGDNANFFLGKYRALNETLIDFDCIMKG